MHDSRRSRFSPVFLAAALLGLLPALAAAQAGTTQVTATEVFDPLSLLGETPVGAFTNPGVVTCPGAEPTGNPMQPCPPHSRILLRGVAGLSRMVSTSPRLAGSLYWEMNANWDADGTGPAWGTFWLELDAGGMWEGSWTNRRSKLDDAAVWVGRAKFAGRGARGSVAGMHLELTVVGTTYTLMPLFWVEPIEAQILEPPSR